MTKYNEEFKQKIVDLIDYKSKTEICNEYGINQGTLLRWEKKYSQKYEGHQKFFDQEKEIKKLKKLLKEKDEEIDILKKVTAIFSKNIK